MTTPQGPGDPWAAQGPSTPGGAYPAAGYPQYPQPGYGQAGYPQAGYPQAGYPQPGYPQAGYPQPGYPGYGAAAYPGYGAMPLGPAPARPGTVLIAFWLWIVTIVVGIVGVVLLFSGSYFDRVLDAAGIPDVGIVTARAFLNVVRIGAAFGIAVSSGLYLLFAFKMRAGRNWARIVLTVLAALGVGYALTFFQGTTTTTIDGRTLDVVFPGGFKAMMFAQLAVDALAIVMMYVGGANQYFAAMKARRMYR